MGQNQLSQGSAAHVLLDCLGASRILRCALDSSPDSSTQASQFGDAAIDSCQPEDLASSLGNREKQYDALWVTGYVTWHSLRAIQRPLTSAIDARHHDGLRPPSLLFEGPAADGPPEWASPEALAAHFVRADAIEEGIRIGVESALERHGYVVLGFSSNDGAVLAIPKERWLELGPLASAVQMLESKLRVEHRRANTALALAYESQSEVKERQASAPRGNPGDALVSQYLAAATPGDEQPHSISLVCAEDGSWSLLDGQVRRYIGSGFIVQALTRALGGFVRMSPDELEGYAPGAPLVVVMSPDERAHLIVGGKRIQLRGFPRVVAVTQRAISGIEVSQIVNVNDLKLPPVHSGGSATTEAGRGGWLGHALRRALKVSRSLAAKHIARGRDNGG